MSEQITITVKAGNSNKQVKLKHYIKNTVLDTLREGGFHLPSLCNSLGKCGRCCVSFAGYAPMPTQADRALLTPDMLRKGLRLSCMARPVRDCTIHTEFSVENKGSIIAASSLHTVNQKPEDGNTIIAVDLGTTTIAMQLLHAGSGEILNTYTCHNPQGCFGTDVVERIRAGSQGKAARLKELVREAVWNGVITFLDVINNKGLCKPSLISIAGNTVMGHLFMGYSTESLGKSPFEPVSIKMIDFQWNGIRTLLVPGISAFVGGDITAGLLTFFEPHKDENWLFLDLGTNAEMVIGKGGHIIATSAAAGPAFEGGNYLGSERIRAAAKLLEQGVVDKTGLLQEPYFDTGILVDNVFIGQKDIRDIQMAKAAVRTGIHFLKEKAAFPGYEFIDRVYLAGGFGFYLDIESASQIGLIPAELTDRLQTVGNTSLHGAGLFGRKMAEGDINDGGLDYLIKSCGVFNLALEKEFEKKYIKYINFDNKE